MSLMINLLSDDAIPIMVECFARLSWSDKSTALFTRYLEEQHRGERPMSLS